MKPTGNVKNDMKNTLEYKGFKGSVEVNLHENILHGKITNIKGLVTYEANNVKEFKEVFKRAVDTYLDFKEVKGSDEDPE